MLHETKTTKKTAKNQTWNKSSGAVELKVRESRAEVPREGFVVDFAKKAEYARRAREQQRRAFSQRPLPAPKKSVRTIRTTEQLAAKLERRRRRGVVKNDWGLSAREERLLKRQQVLEKRLATRRHRRANRGRRAPRSNSNTATNAWLSNAESNAGMEDVAPNEHWWGGALDAAIDIAPAIISAVSGMGDYTPSDLKNQSLPKMNSLAAAFSEGEMCNEVPAMHTIGQRTRFTHREYIGDLYSTTSAFVPVTFPLNPGMNETFPWGSRAMLSFTEYEMQGAMLDFVSEGSEYSNSVGLGYVAMSSQYNVFDPAYTSKKEMLQSEFAVARKPSESFCHWIECDPAILATPKKYIRGGPVPTGADKNFYDHCNMTVATGGHSAPGVIIGELWLTYDVLVAFPRADEARNQSHLYCKLEATGVDASNPMGTAWTFAKESTFLPKGQSNVAFFFPDNFPAADFDVLLGWNGTGNNTNYVMPTVTTVGMAFIGKDVWGFNANYTATTNSPGFCQRFLMTTTGANGASIELTTAQWVGPTTSKFNLLISQRPRATESTPVFDYGGREAEERFVTFMDTVRPKSDPEGFVSKIMRLTSRYEMRATDTGAIITDLLTFRSGPIDVKVVPAMMTFTDALFDQLAEELTLR